MEKKINIHGLALYFSKIAYKNKFLIKPNDLKILYIIFFWEYISQNFDKNIKNDNDIILNETNVLKIIKIIFHSKYSEYLENILKL